MHLEQENQAQQHKRRVRYKGKYPKKFEEKYKELQPEKYQDTVQHVIRKGNTPAGMHISIMVKEILDFLQIQPWETGFDATLGYGGHTKAMLECLHGEGHMYATDVDPEESAKTKKRLEELGVPAPTKWSDLWDERLSGEILMQNSVRDAFTVALKMKGYSLNSTNPDELAEARDLLIEQKPLVQAYVIDQVRDKMIGGEAAVGVIYSGEMLYIQDAVAEQGLDYSLEYVIPEEGTNYWIDSWVIPANAEHKENAEKWIDFLCRPDIAKKNFEYITYATPNTGAYDLLDDGLKNNKALFPDLDKLPNCEIIQYLGDDVDTIYNDMWKEIKSE